MIKVTKEKFYDYVLDESFVFPNDIVHHNAYSKCDENNDTVCGMDFMHRSSRIIIGHSKTIHDYENDGPHNVYELTQYAIDKLEGKNGPPKKV